MTGEPQRIVLGAEFSADPLQNDDPDHPEYGCMMELDDVPLRPGTVVALRRWADRYEAALPWFTTGLGEWPPGEVEAFDREGVCLWRRLRAELAPMFEIVFYSEQHRRVFDHPDEYNTAPAPPGRGRRWE